jgi:hypothetical protein
MKFRKKPVVIEAVQISHENDDAILVFMQDTNCPFEVVGDHEIVIHTLEGDMTASPGDWIIRGVKGEFYPCKPDIFEATYEKVE